MSEYLLGLGKGRICLKTMDIAVFCSDLHLCLFTFQPLIRHKSLRAHAYFNAKEGISAFELAEALYTQDSIYYVIWNTIAKSMSKTDAWTNHIIRSDPPAAVA